MMRRTLAGAYFAVLCLHAASWLATLLFPTAEFADYTEPLAFAVIGGTPLILLAALFRLAQPRRVVAEIALAVVVLFCLEASRAVSTFHAPPTPVMALLSGVIPMAFLLLGIAGMRSVIKGDSKPSAVVPSRHE
jgi:hypothetical protein